MVVFVVLKFNVQYMIFITGLIKKIYILAFIVLSRIIIIIIYNEWYNTIVFFLYNFIFI